MARVTILKKSDGVWSNKEIISLEKADVVLEILTEPPKKIVAVNKPSGGRTFQNVLGHNDFSSEEVEEGKAW